MLLWRRLHIDPREHFSKREHCSTTFRLPHCCLVQEKSTSIRCLLEFFAKKSDTRKLCSLLADPQPGTYRTNMDRDSGVTKASLEVHHRPPTGLHKDSNRVQHSQLTSRIKKPFKTTKSVTSRHYRTPGHCVSSTLYQIFRYSEPSGATITAHP